MICHLRNTLLAVAVFPAAAFAQLQYSYTDFVHGLHDDNSRFIRPNTAGLLSYQVDLKTPRFPNPDGTASINTQADQLFSDLAGQGHVLVGHSMGGLNSRAAYFRHPDPGTITGIITVTTPHQGAPIADNALRVAGYAVDQVTDFIQELINIGYRPTPGNILSAAAVDLIQWLFREVVTNHLLAFVTQEFGLKDAALNDNKTTSPTVNSLGSTFDALPHANVVGTIPRRNAIFRVAASITYQDGSYDSWIHKKNVVKSIAKACRQIGWNFIIRTHVGRICNQVDNVIGSLDDRWAYFTMGAAEKRDPNATFDGVVPTSHSRYPGTSLTDPTINFTGPMANHMNVQYSSPGITAIARAMSRIGMGPPPPPPPPPGTIGSVTISGPTAVEAGCTGGWVANPYGGVGPYTYVWNADGTDYDTGSDGGFSYAPSQSFVLRVTVTDSQGSTGSQSQYISIISGNCS